MKAAVRLMIRAVRQKPPCLAQKPMTLTPLVLPGLSRGDFSMTHPLAVPQKMAVLASKRPAEAKHSFGCTIDVDINIGIDKDVDIDIDDSLYNIGLTTIRS